jgi:hypothetical protein
VINPLFFEKSVFAEIGLIELKLNNEIMGFIQMNIFSNCKENLSFDNIFSSILSPTVEFRINSGE